MHTSGFTHTPVSKALVASAVLGAILASLTDTKYLFHIALSPHLFSYRQWWRLLIWQAVYANSTEVLFAVLTIYQGRVVERAWGSRKFASFLLLIYPYTTILPVLLLTFLRPLSNLFNYLPSGPTPLLFAILAQYHASIPYVYKYRLSTGPGGSSSNATAQSDSTSSSAARQITLTSKSLSYIPAFQLAFSSFPGSLVGAVVGWAVGYAYRNDVLPGASAWRVPRWVVGEVKSGEGYEGLRRRLEGESRSVASGRSGAVRGDGEERRRTLGGMVGEMFGGEGR